jgi:hypothetical protein
MAKILGVIAGVLAFVFSPAYAEAPRIKVLFLGDNGHHQPIERAGDLLAPLAHAGIDMAYTDDLNDLNHSSVDNSRATRPASSARASSMPSTPP